MAARRDPLVLEDQLCFALYAASRAMTTRYRPMLDKLGLTYPQFLVLVVLWERGEATVSSLGQQLRLDSGTLSPLLKRLELAGLITRARGVDDERSVRISPTPAADALRERAGAMPDAIRGCIGTIDEGSLLAQLHVLEAALRAD